LYCTTDVKLKTALISLLLIYEINNYCFNIIFASFSFMVAGVNHRYKDFIGTKMIKLMCI